MRMRTLGILVIAVVVLAACGTEEGEGTTTTTVPEATTTADAGQEETTTTAPADATTSAAEAMDGVHVAETNLGPILVDPDGFTLYIFTVDSGGESACYDECAELWPPVPADTPISPDLDAAMFGSTERTDGTAQLTVNGMPLYLYTPDTNPGDTTGQGFNDVWFVVDVEGNMIEAAAGSSSDEEDAPPDYDY